MITRFARWSRGAKVGPFAHIRPQSDGRRGCARRQLRRTEEDDARAGSKANHLAYLGDATIGEQRQHRRRHDHLQLRRRRRSIRRSSRTAPSSAATRSSSRRCASARARTSPRARSITEDVPAGALAIARGKQVNKDGWVEKKKQEMSEAQRWSRGVAVGSSVRTTRGSTTEIDRSQHVRNHRIHRRQAGPADSDRRAAPARVSRLRLGRRGGRPRRHDRAAPQRRQAGAARGGHRRQSARRRVRHRPHAMGDARPSDRGERASAPRLHRPHRRRPQRHHRELPRSEAAAAERRAHASSPRPTPRSSRTWSNAR